MSSIFTNLIPLTPARASAFLVCAACESATEYPCLGAYDRTRNVVFHSEPISDSNFSILYFQKCPPLSRAKNISSKSLKIPRLTNVCEDLTTKRQSALPSYLLPHVE